MTPPIPQLVFSTRSPSPKSGPDFVREVVAESPGIADEVRAEFARRADIAGSILQHELQHAVYMFCPVSADAWLLSRAVSLGLYRKGSNQLLVHGLILAEEHLEVLEGNPLLLDLQEVQEGSGLAFRNDHPGAERRLPLLTVDGRIADRCRLLNRERLEQLAERRQEPWLAAGYDGLAGGGRVGFAMASPEPALLEGLLLHFHQDDRLGLSFHTFYSHSRAVDYRLLAIASDDAQEVRGQFRDLRLLDLSEPAPELPTVSLGRDVINLRRASTEGFLRTLEAYRLTYWSRRFPPPLVGDDPALVLRSGLGVAMTPAEEGRLQKLAGRGRQGLRHRITILAGIWRDESERFTQQLSEVVDTKELITPPRLSELLAAPPVSLEERWCVLALLMCDEGLLQGQDWREERKRAWRTLMPPETLPAFLAALNPVQETAAEAILLEYALEGLAPAVGGPPGPPPYWETLCAWLVRRGRLKSKVLTRVENALERLGGSVAEAAWPQLQALSFQAGLPGEALRLLFSRIRPGLSPADAADKTKAAIRWWLTHGAEHDAAVAFLLGPPDVAGEALPLLGDWLTDQLAVNGDQAYRRVIGILEGIEDLSASVGPACGRLLASIALTRLGTCVPAVLQACLKVLSDREENRRKEFIGAALASAAATLTPILEEPCPEQDLGRRVQAVVSLLETRNGHRATTAVADAELLHLAVRGRILAEEARSRNLAKEAVKSLHQPWLAFLSNIRVLEHLAVETGFSIEETVKRVEEWLNLLQDEIAINRPRQTEEDPRFKLFIRLAWWRWAVSENGFEKSAVCAKLWLVMTWGQIPASSEWLRQRMEDLLPSKQWKAAGLLLPRAEPWRFRLFGGK